MPQANFEVKTPQNPARMRAEAFEINPHQRALFEIYLQFGSSQQVTGKVREERIMSHKNDLVLITMHANFFPNLFGAGTRQKSLCTEDICMGTEYIARDLGSLNRAYQ